MFIQTIQYLSDLSSPPSSPVAVLNPVFPAYPLFIPAPVTVVTSVPSPSKRPTAHRGQRARSTARAALPHPEPADIAAPPLYSCRQFCGLPGHLGQVTVG